MFLTLLIFAGILAAGPGNSEKILIAHRGASAYAPEHTVGAYQLAIAQGADYVEQDLQITRDGKLVCLHDETLERTTNVKAVFPTRYREVWSEGKKLQQWFVVDFTLKELQTLDAGSWFGEAFRGLKILSFREAIKLVRGRAGLYPELKGAEFYRSQGFDMENLFVDSLKRARLWEPGATPGTPVIIQSFEPATLRRLRSEFGCRLPTVLLINERMRPYWTSDTALEGIAQFASGIGPEKRIIWSDPKLVARAHQEGLTVTPYTFRSKSVPAPFVSVTEEMRHYLNEFGVDALFTDNPDLFPRAGQGKPDH